VEGSQVRFLKHLAGIASQERLEILIDLIMEVPLRGPMWWGLKPYGRRRERI
jgi:hypothetical protein